MQPEPAEGVPLTPAPMPPFPQVTGAGTGTANATTHHKALKPSSPSSPSSTPPETRGSQCASHHHNAGIAPITDENPENGWGTYRFRQVQRPCCGAAYSSPPPCCAAIIPADCAHSGAPNTRTVSQICQNGPRKRPGAHAWRYEGCRTVATSTTVTSKAGV